MGCNASHDAPLQNQGHPQRAQAQEGNHEKKASAHPKPKHKEDQVTDIEVKSVKVDRNILVKYINLEKEIYHLEAKNVLKALKVKEGELSELKNRVLELEKKHNESVKRTAKEKADVDQLQEPSVKQFLEDQGQYDQAFTKEQEEYLEALNKQEIVKKELDGAKHTLDLVTNETNTLRKDAAQITELYRQQDELLASIFDGKYGSELEYMLESQLDTLLDRKQRVGVAKYKWQNGRALLQHAVDQLGQAVNKWVQIQNLRADNTQLRYTVATEARNSLVAAHQNICSAQRYLASIQFPYCKPGELDTLQRATSNIYTDMQTPQRHAHALNCYNVTYRRAGALLQWFDHVIENTIMKDIERSALNVATKEQELRRERLVLIKAKIREQLGDDISLDVEKEMDELEKQTGEREEQDGGHLAGTMAITADDEVTTAKQSCESAKLNIDSESASDSALEPLPPGELAPAPNIDDIFGDIDKLRKQHERDMEDLDKTQELNKARIDQGLQEKLRARLSRRKRHLAQGELEVDDS